MDYSNGKIYKMTCPSGHYYIGSTASTLTKRKSWHKGRLQTGRQQRLVFQVFENYDWETEICMELLENYPCASKKELNVREDFYLKDCIDDEKCLNRNRAVKRTKEEMRQYHQNYRIRMKELDDKKEKGLLSEKEKIDVQKREYNRKIIAKKKEEEEEKDRLLTKKIRQAKEMGLICEFCQKILSTPSSLKNHQQTTKYCIELRGRKAKRGENSKIFSCEYCHKKLSTKQRLLSHNEICKKRLENNVGEKLSEKDKLILKLETQIKELQNQLAKAAMRPINVTNNQQNKIGQINNFTPITDKLFQDHVKNLTLEHIKAGPSGYARYALDYPLKDNIVCTDFSRRKIKYKNEDGHVVTDPEMTTLSRKLFSAIKDRNSELIQIYSKDMQTKLWGIPIEAGNELDEKEADELHERMNEVSDVLLSIMSQDRQVRELANGTKSELYHDFLRHVCSGCVS